MWYSASVEAIELVRGILSAIQRERGARKAVGDSLTPEELNLSVTISLQCTTCNAYNWHCNQLAQDAKTCGTRLSPGTVRHHHDHAFRSDEPLEGNAVSRPKAKTYSSAGKDLCVGSLCPREHSFESIRSNLTRTTSSRFEPSGPFIFQRATRGLSALRTYLVIEACDKVETAGWARDILQQRTSYGRARAPS